MNARLLFVHALSPLHAGTGQGVGVIDLPIAREKATNLPYLPGSSLKGSLRDLCKDRTIREKIFGPETNNAEEHAGSVQFSDQRLILLPVRSLAGTFGWITAPILLQRLIRDAKYSEIAEIPKAPTVADFSKCLVTENDCKITMTSDNQLRVFIEDLDLTVEQSASATQWAKWIAECVFPDDVDWQMILKGRFCVVHDDVFNFLLNTATEITARIKLLEDTKTVQKGGLWYEEALPAESILYGLVLATPVKKTEMAADEIFEKLQGLMNKPAQFGGNANVGRGLCRLRLNGRRA